MSKCITIIKNEEEVDLYFGGLQKNCIDKGFKVDTVRLQWKNSTLSNSLKKLEDHNYSETVIAFSVNAFLAMYLSNKNIKNLILISPSPFFLEYILHTPVFVRNKLGKRRLKEIDEFYSIKKINKIFKHVIVGSNEPILVQKVCKLIKPSNLQVVLNANHNLSCYIESISLVLDSIYISKN